MSDMPDEEKGIDVEDFCAEEMMKKPLKTKTDVIDIDFKHPTEMFGYVKQEKYDKLEAELKRATIKLGTIDAVAKQLVIMTNIATNHKIQIVEANKILDEPHVKLIKHPDIERIREVLK